MFKTHYDSMRPGPTPERVLAITRMLEQNPMTMTEIVQHCELQNTSGVPSEGVRRSVTTAEELGLITKKDGFCIFNAEKSVIESATSFRRYVSQRVFSNPDTTFFKATEWFIGANDTIQSISTFQTFQAEMGKFGISSIDENDVLGWRFWIRFLGIAYQYSSTLIPNMAIRLCDAMQSFSAESTISALEYLDWLRENIPEAAASCSQRQLCLGISNGLHTLADLGKIELASVKDAEKVNLFPLEGIADNSFSKLVVKEAIHDEMA